MDAGRRGVPARLPGSTGDAHADTDKDANMDANGDYNRYAYDDAIAYVYRHLGAYYGAADADHHRYLNTLTIAADKDTDKDTNMDANQHGDGRTDSDGHRYTYPADSYADAKTYRIAYANEFTHDGANAHTVTVASSWPVVECAAAGCAERR